MLRLLAVFVYLLSTYRYIRCKVLNYLSNYYEPYSKGNEMAHYRYGFVVFCFFGVMAFCTGQTLKVILDYCGIMDYIKARLWLSTIWDFGIGFYAARFGNRYGSQIEYELRTRWCRGCNCRTLQEYKYKTKMNYDCMCYHHDNRFLYKLNRINNIISDPEL